MLIDGKEPDEYQEKAIKSDKNVLLIAAAGSGKTFTILGKIQYLLNQNIKPEEILLISFTNKSVNDLKKKVKINADILTFHKLAIAILKANKVNFQIASDDLLEYITEEFFLSLTYDKLIIKILKYFHMTNYQDFLKSRNFIELKKIIITFIHLYKTNAKSSADIIKIYPKNSLLMYLIIQIMQLYQEELKSNNSLDFDDLITEATKYASTFKSYKYIIIDEFQDTSLIRWNLIYELKQKSNATLFVVGDDYQSIFHFSGCDINIFLNFPHLIANAEVLKLKYTYRNSQELINISSKFIMQNKAQIKKELLSHKHLNKPIKIKYYLNAQKGFKVLLKKVSQKYRDILVLGRNNFDLKKFMTDEPTNFRYMTIHSSKGLEADVVIIINLENSLYGLPNQIKNNILIQSLHPEDQNILYAEERRLFYVALTRTRNEVYLLVPIKNKSPFIKEIKKLF